MEELTVVFVSHNDLGLACLEELETLGANVRAVYTRPRGANIADQTDFRPFADQAGADHHAVESVNDADVIAQMRSYEPDLLFVVGWSRLVTQTVIGVPAIAALGMHPAPLPRGRGRAPVAWSLIKGLDETALSCFHLVEAADAGDLVGQQSIDIDIEDDAGALYEKVVAAGRELIREYYPRFANGEVPRLPQDEDAATWWPARRPHHGLIDWTRSPMAVYNWIRGQSHPYPGAYSHLDGRRVTIWAANPPSGQPMFAKPGRIEYRDGDALGIGAFEGVIEVTRIQIEDDESPASALLQEYDVAVGDTFENARDGLDRR